MSRRRIGTAKPKDQKASLKRLLAYLGQKLNVDIYLAAIIVFVGRMFNNLSILRRHYMDFWANKVEKLKKKEDKVEDKEKARSKNNKSQKKASQQK